MLSKPEDILRTNLKANWFADETHRQLAYTLLNTEKQFADFSEIELEVKGYYPKSSVTEEWLHTIKFEEIYVKNIKHSVRALEVEYLKDRAHEASLRYAEYPNQKNKENLEDWLRKMNESEVEEDDGELQTPTEQLLYELDNEVELGLQTYPKLNRILGAGLEGGMLFVTAGRPGTGKSAYAINLCIEALQRQPDLQIDFFSLEMTKIEMLKRFISRLTGINGYKFKNAKVALNDDEKRDVIQKADWINKTGLRIHDDKFKLSDIERSIRQRRHENRDKDYMAVVDYIGLVNGEDSRMPRPQIVGKISRTLKMLTNELNIPIILLSQLNRAVEQRDSKVPTLSDLRESGDLEQDANVVVFLSENAEIDNMIDLTVAKNRSGQLATLHYEFFKPAMTFTEAEAYDD